jgi:hypothetical protein
MDAIPISRVKKHLSSWGTGRVEPLEGTAQEGSLTVVLENADHLDALLASDVVGDRTLVLAPGESRAGVVGYDGSLAEPGGDLAVDDEFFLQTQDYASACYMSVIGATLVRVVEQADFDAFLDDADRARAEGVFPAHVTSPAVQLADLAALGGGPVGEGGPRTRLYTDADGVVSVSPWAAPLGTLADGLDRLDAEWRRLTEAAAHPGAVALARAVPEAAGAAAAERPWLGRYLAAVDAQRELHARGIAGLRVSGFGSRLSPVLAQALNGQDGQDGQDGHDTDLPLLLWTEDAAYVHITGARRTFRVDHAAGALVEALLVCGSVDAAAAYADRSGLLRAERLLTSAGIRLRAVTPA